MNNYEKLKQMEFEEFVRALEECGCPPVPCAYIGDESKDECIRCWQAWLQRDVYYPYPGESVADQSEEQDDHAQDGTEEQEDKKETSKMAQETPADQEKTAGPERYWYTLGSDGKILVTDNKAEVNGPSWRFMPIDLSGALQAYGVQQTLRGLFGQNMDFAAKSKKYATMVHEAHNYVVATRDAFVAKADIMAWLWFYKADSDDWKDALHADWLCAFKEARKWDEILQSKTRLDEFIDGFCYGTNGESDTETKYTKEE